MPDDVNIYESPEAFQKVRHLFPHTLDRSHYEENKKEIKGQSGNSD